MHHGDLSIKSSRSCRFKLAQMVRPLCLCLAGFPSSHAKGSIGSARFLVRFPVHFVAASFQ